MCPWGRSSPTTAATPERLCWTRWAPSESSNLHQVRVEGVPEHFYTVYMAYHKKHVHSRAVTDFIDFVKAYPGNDLIGQVLPEAAGE